MKDPRDDDGTVRVSDEVHKIERETKKIMLKCSVPVQDFELLEQWGESCKVPLPNGFGDYRWAKIWYDHKFVRDFKPSLESIQARLIDQARLIGKLREELAEIKAHIKGKDKKDNEAYSNAGTFG